MLEKKAHVIILPLTGRPSINVAPNAKEKIQDWDSQRSEVLAVIEI
jgi:hypothetical protein